MTDLSQLPAPMLLMLALSALGAVTMIGQGIAALLTDRDRESEWMRVRGRVVGTDLSPRRMSRNSPAFWPIVEYAGPDGVTRRASPDQMRGARQLALGDELDVLVDPVEPERIVVPESTPRQRGWRMILVGVAVLLVGAAIVFAPIAQLRPQDAAKYLVPILAIVLGIVVIIAGLRSRRPRDAVQAIGTIVGLRSSDHDSASHSYVHVIRFTTLDGREITGTARASMGGTALGLGKDITVHYDPRNPERFTTASSGFAMVLALLIGLVFVAGGGLFLWMMLTSWSL